MLDKLDQARKRANKPEVVVKVVVTNQEKRRVIEAIYEAWCKVPELRLGQLIANAVLWSNAMQQLYYEPELDVVIAEFVASVFAK